MSTPPADPTFGGGVAPASLLHFERAGNRHLDQIRRLHLAGLVDSGSLSLDPTLDNDLVDVEESYSEGYFVLVSFADAPEVLVGMGAIRHIDGNWHVKRMRVNAAHRRMGIAQAVLDRLLAEARLLGVGVLMLDTSAKQVAAQRLYERNGFVRIGTTEIGGLPSFMYRLDMGNPLASTPPCAS
jgi:ribosomal protein S18 acetylase RimI-like enzyme